MPPVGFEPTISAGERPKTYALDRAATGTGFNIFLVFQNMIIFCFLIVIHHTLRFLKIEEKKNYTIFSSTLLCFYCDLFLFVLKDHHFFYFFSWARQPQLGLDLLIHEVLIAHISKEDNWPIRKSELVKKYLKQVIHFTNSIEYEKL